MSYSIFQFDTYKKIYQKTKDTVKNIFIDCTTDENKNKYKSEAFDPNYYDKLVGTHDYKNAISYARSFVPNDPEERRQRNLMIDEEEKKFKILEKKFETAPTDEAKDAIEFNQLVYADGGLDQLAKYNPENIFYKRLKDVKNELGGTNATKLQITFQPKKNTFLGLDILAPDNDNSFEDFVKESGLSENYLNSITGIEVKHNSKDNTTTLTFDKSNALANKILYSMPNNNNLHLGWNMVGLDEKGNVTTTTDARQYTANTNLFSLTNVGDNHMLNLFKTNIDSAKNYEEAFTYSGEDDTFNYPAIIGPFLDDNIDQLNKLRDEGQITETEYQHRMSEERNLVYTILSNPDLSQLSVYSDYNEIKKGELSNAMNKLSDQDAADILNYITSGTKNDARIGTVTFNGEVGLYINIGANKTAEKKISKDSDIADLTTSTPVRVYITGKGLGDLNDIISQKLQQNSFTKTALEMADMKKYNISYTMQDGEEMLYNMEDDSGADSFIYKGEIIDRDTAMKEINKDLSIKDISNNLVYDFINSKGEIINSDTYDYMIKQYSMQIANEYMPETPIVDDLGNPLNANQIFDIVNTLGLEEFTVLFNSRQGKKIKTIMDVYKQLRDALSKHDYSNVE